MKPKLFVVLWIQTIIRQTNKSIDGQRVVLHFMSDLRLQITQLFLQLIQTRQHNSRRFESTRRLDSEVELIWFSVSNIVGLVFGVLFRELCVFTARPFFWFGEKCMSEGIVRIVLEGHSTGRVPFGVFFTKTFQNSNLC